MSLDHSVKVFVRIRPSAKFSADTIELHSDKKSVTIHGKKDERRGYINNQILDWTYQMNRVLHNVGQEEVFERCAKESVMKSLDGFNTTIMAYGQTGAGKTFTMSGSCENFQQRGIIPRTISQIYSEISNRKDQSISVSVSYLEIYNETMYDLLSTIPGTPFVHPSLLSVSEEEGPSCRVKGLSVHITNSEEEALNLFFEGEMNRIVASHSLNRNSSRSHCNFTMYIETKSRVESSARYTLSKINLVDLAGSERIGKTETPAGVGQQEALYINKSLTFLEQVIIALGERKRKHVPYRQSKLTHVLSDSIGGKSDTVLIANIWGEESQIEETISTLRFGARMKSVYCEPAVNEVYDPVKQCKNYQAEIKFLKNELTMHDTLTNRSQVVYEPLSQTQCKELKEEVQKYIDHEVNHIEIVNLRQINEILEIFREIVNRIESATEQRLREKYEFRERNSTLIEDIDDRTAASSQDSKRVGEPDGRGFGIGKAPASQKGNVAALIPTRGKLKSRRGKDIELTEQKQVDSQVQDGEVRSSDTAETRICTPGADQVTPPPKSEAFVEFKQERGSEINRIFNENKEILRSKKQTAKELSMKINTGKSAIDNISTKLHIKQEKREAIGGSVLPETEREVIDEEELNYLQKFQELKRQYRIDFEELRSVKSDIQCCEKFVSQCRKRLVSEFEAWYAECYLSEGNIEELESDGRKSGGLVLEDEQEKFDRLQLEYLMDEPESVAYYNAQMQTQRRAFYTDVGRQRQKPGAIKKRTNNPPGTLTVF